MVPQTFLFCFPGFRETDGAIIAACLARAASRMGGPDQTVWGSFANTPTAAAMVSYVPSKADLAQGNLAAHYIVSDPLGTQLAKADDEGTQTEYMRAFLELQDSVAGGVLVAGQRW